MKLKKKTIVQASVICAVLAIGAAVCLGIPEAVESFLPCVETTYAVRREYAPSVTANGRIQFIDGTGEWLAVLAVGEEDISLIEVGQSVILSGAAFGNGYIGTVSEISHTAWQSVVGTISKTVVDVTVSIGNGDEGLRAGYSVTGSIETAEKRTVFVLPYNVIGQDDDGEFVYVLENSCAVRRGIVTGTEFQDGAEIISGIQPDEQIIVNPSQISPDTLVKSTE